MVPSPQEIEAAKSSAGGYSQETLAGWGVSWPPPKGWKSQLAGLWEAARIKDRLRACNTAAEVDQCAAEEREAVMAMQEADPAMFHQIVNLKAYQKRAILRRGS